MALVELGEWNVRVRCEASLDGDAINRALDTKLGRALAIIEDELRSEFGEVSLDRSQ